MLRYARTYGLCGLLFCVAGWMALGPVEGQQRPQRVTTDTPQYCLALLDRVSTVVRGLGAPPPQEVTSLSSDGQRMCDEGQTRGGIMRLRRALVLLRQEEGIDPNGP